MNAERRMPSSSYLVPRRWIMTRQARTAPAEQGSPEPLWRRWYVAWLAAAIAMLGLIIAAVVALAIVTLAPERPAPPATPAVEKLISES